MRVLVMTAMWPTPDNPAFGSFVRSQVEALRQAGVDLELLVLKGRIRKLIYPAGVLQMHRRLASGHFDLIHAHYGFVGWVARMQLKVPVVVSFCGDDLLGTPDRTGRKTPASLVLAMLCRTLSNFVDGVIVKSDEMAHTLACKDIHVIPNEVDMETFDVVDRELARAELGLSPSKKYLLFAADPAVVRKRFDFARAVANQLRRLDPRIVMLVVNRETQARLALYMNACDALIFPSYQEGSPNVVKQAMACNLPVVATDVGSVRQILGAAKHCAICAPEPADFTAALSAILRHRPRSDGRDHVSHLAGPLVARQVIGVYEETLGKRPVNERARRETLGISAR